jgi:hypothetical protein
MNYSADHRKVKVGLDYDRNKNLDNQGVSQFIYINGEKQ